MDVDVILDAFNRHGAEYLLIGGVNFLLRHQPVLTYDVDLWIEDTEENRRRCEAALRELAAEWGASESEWGPVGKKPVGWLDRQSVYCLDSPHGAIDVFRAVRGLGDWTVARQRAVDESTAGGIRYAGLSDEDMLQCQLALDEADQKSSRVQALRAALSRSNSHD